MVNVVVVGGGVNGIGTSLALLRKWPHCQLTIYSDVFTPETTGDKSAGFFTPFLDPDTSQERILSWTKATWSLCEDLYKSGRDLGVYPLHGVAISREFLPRLPWHDVVYGYTPLTQEQYSKYGQDYQSGYSYSTFASEASKFLPTMMKEVESLGGRTFRRHVNSLEEVATSADLVINCSGLGARDLLPDQNVYPVRGQVMRVRAPGQVNFLLDKSEDSLAYILPNTETVVLGGTSQKDDWRTEIDPSDSADIWRKCTTLVPSLKTAEVVREWAGLRPGRRGGVRLEADEIKLNNRTVPVVHNYGHGGSGVTLFWGCSNEAADIAINLIHKFHGPASKL